MGKNKNPKPGAIVFTNPKQNVTTATPPLADCSPLVQEAPKVTDPDPNRLQLTWTFSGYWHAGTGEGGYNADATVDLDDDGLPKLDGKHCKGLLREAAALLSAANYTGWVDSAAGTDIANSSTISAANSLFGTADTPSPLYFSAALVASPERAELLVLPSAKQQLTRVLRSTAIDPATQTAKTGSLRSKQVAVPMALVQTIAVKPGEGEPDGWKERLKEAASLIRHAGGSRERGLGRVEVTVSEVAKDEPKTDTSNNNPPAQVAPDQWTRLTLTLRAESRLVFSASAATLGAHQTTPVIEGARLMGWAAGALFSAKAETGAGFANTTQGGITFGDARPVAGDCVTEPLAASLKSIGAKKPAGGWVQSTANTTGTPPAELHDTSTGPYKDQTRLYSAPQALVAQAGLHSPAKRYRLRTATADGTAKESQLFSYDSLQANQLFQARCLLPADTASLVAAQFAQGKRLHLGRSKNTEYGELSVVAAEVEVVNLDTEHTALSTAVTENIGDGGYLRILCLSHLQVFNHHGQPTAVPSQAEWLGLPAGTLCLERSTVVPYTGGNYNGFYRRHEGERLLIGRGSVLCFKSTLAADSSWVWTEQHTLRWLRGLGEGQERGYGEVRLWNGGCKAPSAAAATEQKSTGLTAVGAEAGGNPPKPKTTLGTWAAERAEAIQAELKIRTGVDALISHIETWLKSAAALKARPSWQKTDLLPSLCPATNQWHQIGDCNTANELEALLMPNRAGSTWQLEVDSTTPGSTAPTKLGAKLYSVLAPNNALNIEVAKLLAKRAPAALGLDKKPTTGAPHAG